jgi:hypothetical protein
MEEKADRPEIQGSDSPVEIIDPLKRADWDSLVDGLPESTVFHGSGWARVLRETYGHNPIYFCRFDGARLVQALPFMDVSSRWTGRRGVSLPFTDACALLVAEDADCSGLYREAMRCGKEWQWKYMECRNCDPAWQGAIPSLEFYGHVIDLKPGVDLLFKGLEGSIRRGVRKAEAAGLTVEFATDRESIRTFYRLLCGTRRRHGLPPQPFRFFENIQRHILGMGRGFVVTTRLGNRPAGAGVFFYRGRGALYKFGASDFDMQQHRPNNLLMWAAMRRCAEQGISTLNLGRTSLSNEGLRRFKLGFGAVEEKMQYAKYDFASQQFVLAVDRVHGWFNRVFASMPLPVLRLAGAALYPRLS